METTLEIRPERPLDEEAALVRYRRMTWLAKGALVAAAFTGLAMFIRELPDLRRYLRLRRM